MSLVGPSRCGKSTLLRIVAGLEQQTVGHIHSQWRGLGHRAPTRSRSCHGVSVLFALSAPDGGGKRRHVAQHAPFVDTPTLGFQQCPAVRQSKAKGYRC
ncbi:ATP-binding cassette domain-containing protein [Rhizobium miluonense]|uniref:ATP-binding cassette domain-containing protein n=1 Tax=Rhizobium miluonense TaxID=411945 RepID=UPI001FD9FF8D|nr:ATP-binding cassette domain-containing protein [Rhizobium miluonense]